MRQRNVFLFHTLSSVLTAALTTQVLAALAMWSIFGFGDYTDPRLPLTDSDRAKQCIFNGQQPICDLAKAMASLSFIDAAFFGLLDVMLLVGVDTLEKNARRRKVRR